jgi:phenylacetate-CoA ligase
MLSAPLRERFFEAKLGLALREELDEYRALLRSERFDVLALRRVQQQRAAELVAFAIANTEWYRDRYAGVDPRSLLEPGAFESLPVLERDDVRRHFARIRSSEATPRNVKPAVTSGSTGEPLRVLRDARANHRTLGWRLHRWWGVSPVDDKALIWRETAPSRWRNAWHDALWWPTRTVQMDANQIDEAAMRRFLAGWKRVRPALLTGYVGAVVEFAQFLERSGLELPPPKAVGVTAAPIAPDQKRFLRDAFGAPVYDHYQCIEVPMIAGECARADGLHVFADARLVELLDDDGRPVGPGESGQVAITDFRNRVFPLIRYRIGDLARWKPGPCPCGVTLPLLEPVEGRISDALRLPSGLVVAGEGLNALFHPYPGAVRQFQLRQDADHSLTLRCVRGSDPEADAQMRTVVARLERLVRGEVPVRLELVEAIPHDRGKARTVVSAVGSSERLGSAAR